MRMRSIILKRVFIERIHMILTELRGAYRMQRSATVRQFLDEDETEVGIDVVSYIGGGGEITRYSDRGKNGDDVFEVAAEGGVVEALSAEASDC